MEGLGLNARSDSQIMCLCNMLMGLYAYISSPCDTCLDSWLRRAYGDASHGYTIRLGSGEIDLCS